MLMVTNSKGRLRYMRFISTRWGSSITHGAHHVAQTLTNRSFLESLARKAFAPARSRGLRSTGSASHFASAFLASSVLVFHFVEQPKTLVVSTGAGWPARTASMALRASWDL